MIYFLVTRKKQYTLDPFFNEWMPEARSTARIINYEDMVKLKSYPPGIYIFTDIDSLSKPLSGFAAGIADMLVNAYGGNVVLNHPSRVLKRCELLTLLAEKRLNSFSVHPLDTDYNKIRFPAFVRKTNGHTGPLSNIVNTPDELRTAVKNLLVSGKHSEDLLIVEFCDTRLDDGYYRKYTAFVVNDIVVPRYVAFSKNWVVKHKRAENTEHEREDREYLNSNPHASEILEIFKYAQIDYGRIDYGIKDGKIQVWEINVNPYILRPISHYRKEHVQEQADFASQMAKLLEKLGNDSINNSGITPVEISYRLKQEYFIDTARCEIREISGMAVPARLKGLIRYYRLQGR